MREGHRQPRGRCGRCEVRRPPGVGRAWCRGREGDRLVALGDGERLLHLRRRVPVRVPGLVRVDRARADGDEAITVVPEIEQTELAAAIDRERHRQAGGRGRRHGV